MPIQNGGQFSSNNSNMLYPASYSDTGYLQMALGAYLTPSASGYKSVDPYFLSQGTKRLQLLTKVFVKWKQFNFLLYFIVASI